MKPVLRDILGSQDSWGGWLPQLPLGDWGEEKYPTPTSLTAVGQLGRSTALTAIGKLGQSTALTAHCPKGILFFTFKKNIP